jgi:tRNA(Arg) A34 adenosine deaminase TadA
MCTGAIIAAKIAKVVIGARWTDAPQYFDQSKPSLLSVGAQVKYPFSYTVGVMREECVKLYEGP